MVVRNRIIKKTKYTQKRIQKTGFARKLNNHIFPGSGYMRKTADNADVG